MKTKILFLLLIATVASVQLNAQPRANKWVLLGERLVNDRPDRDVIDVTSARGEFSAILIKVKGASVDFHKVVVVYGNGRRQEIEMRETIAAGGSSRVIDLAGTERVIRKIEFVYDANTIRGRKAMVRVFGRR